MSKIFISHSSKDNEFVKKLGHDLLSNGIPIWLDAYELSIGDSLYDKIFAGIKECNYLIVVISENYNNTIWTSKEFKAILSKEDNDGKKYLIPIKIDNSKVPLEISDRLYQNFESDYDESVKKLVRFFRKEDFSIKLIPLAERQIILNFIDNVHLDIDIIKSVLSDLHLHKTELVLKKQIFFNGYQAIDDLLKIAKENLLLLKDNKAILKQYNDDCKEIENYIDNISKGIIIMLNEYKSDNNIESISKSIYWFVKIFMDTIYSIILRYFETEKLIELNLANQKFYYYPISAGLTFSEFYNVKGSGRLDVFDKNDSSIYCSITVDEDCYAYRELVQLPVHMTFSEAFSSELLYNYLIPQNVFAKVLDEDRVQLLTNFRNYLVGLS